VSGSIRPSPGTGLGGRGPREGGDARGVEEHDRHAGRDELHRTSKKGTGTAGNPTVPVHLYELPTTHYELPRQS
jgi:hypothetical protein